MKGLTYKNLLDLECSLECSIYQLDEKIRELKCGNLRDGKVRERLEFDQRTRDEYLELYGKLKDFERDCDDESTE